MTSKKAARAEALRRVEVVSEALSAVEVARASVPPDSRAWLQLNGAAAIVAICLSDLEAVLEERRGATDAD